MIRDELAARLSALEAEGLRRFPLTITAAGPSADQAPDVTVTHEGQLVRAINLATNDYLGLATHPSLREAAARAAEERCVGVGAARLVTGTLDQHQALEEALARLLGEERALLFGSGYLAHVGTIPALAGEGDVIFSDERNHASIVDACRLARAQVRVYRHLDVDHLQQLLSRDSVGGRKLVVTETVFSMDGDEAPLVDLCRVASTRGAWVMVDEAHAFGIRGPSGAGLVAELGLVGQVDLRMATLGKAIGAYGAFVAGCSELADYLMNRARTFIYSTALPAPDVAAALAGVELVSSEEGELLRCELRRASSELRQGLLAQGWQILKEVPGPILPLHVGDPRLAVILAERLLERGVLARAMRYPTVPPGTERLRLVASAVLGPQHTAAALAAFAAEREGGARR